MVLLRGRSHDRPTLNFRYATCPTYAEKSVVLPINSPAVTHKIATSHCHIKHILAADVKHIMAPQQQYARGACRASGGQMGVGLGCYVEPKQGGLVGPVAKICYMLRPLYGLCDTGGHIMLRKSGHNMGKITLLS